MNDPVNHSKHYTEHQSHYTDFQKNESGVECNDETQTSTKHPLRETHVGQVGSRQAQHSMGMPMRLREFDGGLSTESEVGKSCELHLL